MYVIVGMLLVAHMARRWCRCVHMSVAPGSETPWRIMPAFMVETSASLHEEPPGSMEPIVADIQSHIMHPECTCLHVCSKPDLCCDCAIAAIR